MKANAGVIGLMVVAFGVSQTGASLAEETNPSATAKTEEAGAAAETTQTPDATPAGAQSPPGSANTESTSQVAKDDDVITQEVPFTHDDYSSGGIGGYWSPNSTFGTEGGLVLAAQSYGTRRRSYASTLAEFEIGRGLGVQAEGYRVFNILENRSKLSAIVGGNPLEFDLDANTNSQSQDYFSWTAHADGGLRFGAKERCFGALTVGVGANSGTQSLGSGDWFRLETAGLFSAVCGDVSLGLSVRNIDDSSGTVAQAAGSAIVFFDDARWFGIGAAFAVTGYRVGGDYASIFTEPGAVLDVDARQTLVRITLQTRFGLGGKPQKTGHDAKPK